MTFDDYSPNIFDKGGIAADALRRTFAAEFAHLGDESTELRSRFAAVADSPGIVTEEDFLAMDYADLYSRVSQITSDGVNAVADVWRAQADELGQLVAVFGKYSGVALSEKWSGRSAEAVASGLRGFLATAEETPIAMTTTANGMDLFEAQLAYARLNVPAPQVADVDAGSWPENGVSARVVQAEALEIEARARAAMAEVYRPGVEDVDARTVALPGLFNPVAAIAGDPVGSSPSATNPGGSDPGLNATLTRNPGTGDSGGATSQNADTPSTEVANPATTNPGEVLTQSATVPGSEDTMLTSDPGLDSSDDEDEASVSPASWLQDPLARSTVDPISRQPTGTPDLTSYTDRDARPTWRPDVSSPVVNPAVPVDNSAATRTASTTSGPLRTGMGGMPGMVPGAGRGQRDDETEHKTPSYLITVDNGNKLIGRIPKVAPPVFGA